MLTNYIWLRGLLWGFFWISSTLILFLCKRTWTVVAGQVLSFSFIVDFWRFYLSTEPWLYPCWIILRALANTKWFLCKSESIFLVEHLDAFLSRLSIIVKDIADLIVRDSQTMHLILQPDGYNRSSLGELSIELFFCHMLWDESNVNVGLEGLLLVLDKLAW